MTVPWGFAMGVAVADPLGTGTVQEGVASTAELALAVEADSRHTRLANRMTDRARAPTRRVSIVRPIRWPPCLPSCSPKPKPAHVLPGPWGAWVDENRIYS